MESIQGNAHVILDYILRSDEGEVLDASRDDGGEPIEYVHGYGMIVPGLETALVGLRAGESKDIVVKPEDGYGDYDDDLVIEVDRNDFPEPAAVAIGDEFIAESPDGDEVPMEVIDLAGDTVVVDANHPLAGMTLRYSVTVRAVRAATEAEIEEAAANYDEAVENADENAPGADLVQLGRKKSDLLN